MIKPCPFCGHEKIIPTNEGMMCMKCEARGPWPYMLHNPGLGTDPKKEQIIQEAKRVLMPGGLMIVIDWKKETNGGLGPPAELKIDKAELKSIIEKEGLTFVRDIDAGTFHFGFTFKK